MPMHGQIDGLSEEFEDYLNGLIISDGYLEKTGAFLQIFAPRYFDWVSEVYTRFTSEGILCDVTYSNGVGGFGGNQDFFRVRTKTYDLFKHLRNVWYTYDKKRPIDNLRFSPAFIASWYHGDGQIKKDSSITLHTNSFDRNEVEALADKFPEIGIGAWCKEYDKKNQPGQFVVVIRANDSERFMEYIEPYKVPCFDYKYNTTTTMHNKKWLDWERHLLYDNYGITPVADISKRLNRSLSSIYHEASRCYINGRGGS